MERMVCIQAVRWRDAAAARAEERYGNSGLVLVPTTSLNRLLGQHQAAIEIVVLHRHMSVVRRRRRRRDSRVRGSTE